MAGPGRAPLGLLSLQRALVPLAGSLRPEALRLSLGEHGVEQQGAGEAALGTHVQPAPVAILVAKGRWWAFKTWMHAAPKPAEHIQYTSV